MRGFPLRTPTTLTAALALCAVLSVAGCPATTDPTDTSTATTFVADVLPIFQGQCIGCHAEGGFSGITLELTEESGYDRIVNQPSAQDASFTLVVPGDADASLLYLKVSSNTPPVGSRMPFFRTPLSDDDIEVIRNWIDQGAVRE